jgi:Tetratricopeptide repeat
MGDPDRAIADYSAAIRIDPNYVAAFVDRRIAYRAKGDLDRAIADDNQAIRLNPNDAFAYAPAAPCQHRRGTAYQAKGDLERATPTASGINRCRFCQTLNGLVQIRNPHGGSDTVSIVHIHCGHHIIVTRRDIGAEHLAT